MAPPVTRPKDKLLAAWLWNLSVEPGNLVDLQTARCLLWSTARNQEEQQHAAYHTSLLRPRLVGRTSTDWNWRNGDDWRCRSRYTRGPSGLHARCDAALFRFPFGRLANDEVHDGQAGTVESSLPGRDGA
jgi:hypothetical protein